MDKDKCLVIFGAGAVTDAWDPILEALTSTSHKRLSIDGANSLMAQQIYLLRWITYVQNADLPIAPNLDAGAAWKAINNQYNAMKHSICRAIDSFQAANRLSPAQGVEPLLSRLNREYSLAFVNTNWDTIIDGHLKALGYGREGENLPTIHLHGTFTLVESLYLPTEIGFETYMDTKTRENHRNSHSVVATAGSQCSTVVLFGVSVSPLDAELVQLLARIFIEPVLKKVIYVSLQKDKKVIRERLDLLLSGAKDRQVQIEWIDGLRIR